MEKSLLEELREIRHERDIALVAFFNDGNIRKDEYSRYNSYLEEKGKNKFYLISDTMKEAARVYSYSYDFDSIKVPVNLGLIYKVEDVDDNNKIKENAEPLNGLVRFYTGPVESYLAGEKTNLHESRAARQGFIKFDTLMNSIEKSKLEYNGPKSFEEFKERILNNEVFEISVTASSLNKEERKENTKEVEEEVIEETPVKKESKILSLFKR